MAGDPLGAVNRGEVSPFLNSVGTVNKSLDLLRKLDRTGLGALNSPRVPGAPLNPTCRVWVQYDSGGTLPAYSCVKLGDPIISAADYPERVLRDPVFSGTTPTAADNAFAIAEEPIKAGFLGRAVVLGTVVADVNVSDATHTYAAPAASSQTLASATSGPCRILWKESGTGIKKAALLIDRQGAASSPVYDDITVATTNITSTSWTALGHKITLPSAGVYVVSLRYHIYAVFTTSLGVVNVMLWNNTQGQGFPAYAGSGVSHYQEFRDTGETRSCAFTVTDYVSESVEIEVQAQRNGATWTTCQYWASTPLVPWLSYVKIG